MSAVEFRGFSFTYLHDTRRVLEDLSLRIEQGQRVGVIGPAGAGKSTLTQALNGLVPQINVGYQEGDVLVNGVNTRDEEVAQLARRVSLVLQDPEMQIFNLTVEDDVAFGPSNLGLPREEIWRRVDYALRETGLEELADRNPSYLSAGEKQSVAIAGALAMQPRVFALDEPVAMLDPIGKEQVFDLISRITESENRTTTIITDSGGDIETIANRVDRLIVLHHGRVILDGAPDEVLRSAELDEIGVGRPQATELFLRLREAGLDLEGIPISLDDAVFLLSRGLRERGIDELRLPPGFGNGPGQRDFGDTIIKVENLHHVYEPDIRALKGVSLSVRQGEVIGIIGQNGSGKTTLARHLVGLLKPSNKDSTVRVAGNDVTWQPLKKTIRQINYVFQNPDDQLFAETVYDEVAFAPKMIGLKGEELDRAVLEALDAFGLHEYSDEYIVGLPENIKVYLAISCVLPLHPQILLLDEPTTGLDILGESVIMRNILKLRDRGETLVIITHNMKTVAAYCDRTVVMRRGEILCEGPTREVFARQELLARADIKPPQVTQLGFRLADFGLTETILTVDEMFDVLSYNLLGVKA